MSTIAATTVAACALALAPLAAASAAVVPDPIDYSADDAAISLAPIGTYETGAFDQSAAEIVAAYGDRLLSSTLSPDPSASSTTPTPPRSPRSSR